MKLPNKYLNTTRTYNPSHWSSRSPRSLFVRYLRNLKISEESWLRLSESRSSFLIVFTTNTCSVLIYFDTLLM